MPEVPGKADDSHPAVRRWTLSRAGIINVYQYDNEILHFGGGRLLLRGVNGSGKSTAMNMLLPFLLDGDTRRIDAAGEQSGVLRAWMLSGREEAQPQGYLWLEVAKGDEHLSFGCGIRANRSTDQVATWWFITSRRPGIDLQLVEGRVPLSREALRAAIAPDVVYGEDQRPAYRAELRRRLFGGADIEQHLHLLRIVRNPRVGDRLDTELPQYLTDALPQLSDAALDDAAQPLEDLEEHRRNVAELTRTADALSAIQAVYRNYARTELHRLVERTTDAVRHCDRARRAEQDALEAHRAAVLRHGQVRARKRELENDVERLQQEIAALEASDAYKSGAQLNDLRGHVDSLTRSAAAAERSLATHRAATARAATAVRAARQEAVAERDLLEQRLSALASLASGCRLTARPPGAPSIAPRLDSADGLELAGDAVDTAAAEPRFSELRTAAQQRRGDVQALAEALRAVGSTELAVRGAEQRVSDAERENGEAQQALATARAALQARFTSWQAEASAWLYRLDRHHAAHSLERVLRPAQLDDVIGEIAAGRSVTAPLQALTEPAIAHHEARRAQLDAALDGQRQIVSELEQRAAELASKQLPEPPALPWQRRAGPALAELVDFAEHVDAGARAGVEAALEASGLLAAEVCSDGSLRLADGQLVIVPDDADAAQPLGALLRADVPEDFPDGTVRRAVEHILRAISTDPAGGADTFVTVDGTFRVGAVRGRHRKAEAEHIGLAARRAALARQRAEAAAALEQAAAARDRLERELEAANRALAEARLLRGEAPADRELINAFALRHAAELRAEGAERRLGERRSELAAAERCHAEAAAEAHALATRLSLPASLTELDAVATDLNRIVQDSREAQRELKQLARAVERWQERGEEWLAARDEQQRSESHLASVADELEQMRTRLAALDASIGVAYRQVRDDIERSKERLRAERQELQEAGEDLDQATRDVVTRESAHKNAVAGRESANEACLQTLAVLRRVLAVPGLVEAAAPPAADAGDGELAAGAERSAPPPVTLPTVEDSPAGARRLAEALRAQVPRPDDPPTTAEGVRQSIRRRRDSLGAGWGAEDRQPDGQLPLHVEVTGPLAHQTPLPSAAAAVQRQLDTMTSLLSAKQQQALRNLLQGLVAREVAAKLHEADELIERMNERLHGIKTTHGIGVKLRWRRRDDLDPELAETIALLAKPPDLRTADEDRKLAAALGRRIDEAHREEPGAPYRELIARVLDYRGWHAMTILLQRPGRPDERLTRRTALSEGEKKIVSYLPLFAAVAASCDGLAASAADAPRFVLLDDAFAKVSEDNHPKLFGLLVELDLDFIATSERLWGTHDTVPELAITEVIRDADLQTIVLEHSRWHARRLERR